MGFNMEEFMEFSKVNPDANVLISTGRTQSGSS